MTGHPEMDELELLAAGQGADELQQHVAACAECAREVAWLKAEKALFARRAQPDVSQLWSGVEARLNALLSSAAAIECENSPSASNGTVL